MIARKTKKRREELPASRAVLKKDSAFALNIITKSISDYFQGEWRYASRHVGHVIACLTSPYTGYLQVTVAQLEHFVTVALLAHVVVGHAEVFWQLVH